jgi:tetratricopeptide (TPR) repeat protein
MLRKKLIVGGIALIAIVLLWFLPRVVVDNEGAGDDLSARDESAPITEADVSTGAPHLPEIPEDARIELARLQENYRNYQNTEKSTTFADSLVAAYAQNRWYDSAAYYADRLAQADPQEKRQEKALELYYEAFTLALDENKARSLGEKVRYYGEAVLDQQPANLDVKAKMAMTFLTTTEPMKGIMMLREVVEEAPDNELAQYNLGLLSIQSQQYDKAIDRFEKVVRLNPDHLQAQFFLGVSYFESGDQAEAKKQFERVKTLSDDPEVLANADEYLSKL